MFYLVLVMIVLAGGVITLVAVQNLSNTTQLEVLIWQAPALPAGLLILGAFILGALLLYLSSVGSAISDRKQIRKLSQRVKELEQKQAQPPQPPQAPSAMMPPQGPAGSGPTPIQMQPTAPIMQMPGMSGPLKS
ncbi:hypothetical protein KSC_059340 [Ktedonobacter sp. SOSP1-52]|uniref:lipopolysaccharide assembly protein LapA domain-containing protein n=1 Tax=Ktedonobacter sp. SOSP1-52 TaxID=2778366 RepID=UPI0019162950|nr:LapA family protein [Ktedonobacter sp. SOSP1-52]GHO67042.1 hypothetical protein KSC_059340 [Ktedonobacter sp. SOSP1-52]